jgi:hypothetical protein
MTRARSLAALAALALLALVVPSVRANAQADVRQVCVSSLPCVDLPNIPMLRRSVTNYVKFRGNLIDLVPPGNLISRSSGVTVSWVKAYHCDGLGCVEARVTVSPDVPLTNRVTIEFMGGIETAFSSGKASMSVIRGGEVTGIAQSPALGDWGQPVTVTLTGRDLGNAAVTPASGSISNLTSSFDRITFTHRASGTAATSVTYKAKDAGLAITNWMFDYRATGNAAIHGLRIDYRAASASASCIASTNPTVPQPTSPPAGSTLAFSSDPVKASVTVVWSGALTGAGSTASTPDTKYEYEVTPDYPAITLSGVSRTTSTTVSPTTATLSAAGATTAKSATVTLSRNQDYKGRVRATQCASTSAPTTGAYSAYSKFTVK